MKKRLFTLALALFLFNVPNIFAAQIIFTPAIIAREQYTDNLFLDHQNEEDDYITTTGLDLTGQILWRTAGIELNYSPTYNSYAENDQLNLWHHAASFYAWKELTRATRFELRDTYLKTDDPTEESSRYDQSGQPQQPVIGVDPNRRGRTAYYTNVATARLTHQFGANDTLYAAYTYSILRDVDVLPGTIVDDNDISNPAAGIAFEFAPRWRIELDASYSKADYVDRNDRTEFDGNIRLLRSFNRNVSGFVNYRHTVLTYEEDFDEDYNIYEPSIGFRYVFRNDSVVEIAGAYYIQDFENSENQEGFNINADITTRWNYRSGYVGFIGISGYDIDDYRSSDSGLNIYGEGRFEAGYSFTSRFSGTVFVSSRYDQYPNAEPDRNQITNRAGAGVTWQAFQWMLVDLSYRFSDVQADIDTDEYTENRATLEIRIAPSNPYRHDW